MSLRPRVKTSKRHYGRGLSKGKDGRYFPQIRTRQGYSVLFVGTTENYITDRRAVEANLALKGLRLIKLNYTRDGNHSVSYPE